MLIDFHGISKRMTDRLFERMQIDTDPIYSERFKKFLRWLGYHFNPFLMSFASFLVLLWMFNRVVESFGIEKLLVIFMAIFVMSMRLGGQKDKI